MTSAISPQTAPASQIGTVLTADDYAQLGARMNRVGFASDDITAFLARIEAQAAAMARDLVVAATTDLLQLVGQVHHDTAMNIYDGLTQRRGTLLSSVHAECARVALAEAQAAPRRRR